MSSVNSELKYIRSGGIISIVAAIILCLWTLKSFLIRDNDISISIFLKFFSVFSIIHFITAFTICFFPSRFTRFKNFILLFTTFNLCYLVVELTTWFLSGFPALNIVHIDDRIDNRVFMFNKAPFVYDFSSGYKWVPNSNCRVVLIAANGISTVFDRVIKINNAGYISSRNYSSRKDSTVKRYLVLGDSFTAGEYNAESWVDNLQDIMKDKKLEFYSFSLSGIGVINWNSIFFNEIVPNYEFDGIIFAFLYDDWKRSFSIRSCSKDSIYIGAYKDIPPLDTLNFFKTNIPEKAVRNWLIKSDKEIDEKIKTLHPFYTFNKPDLYFLELVYHRIYKTSKAVFFKVFIKKDLKSGNNIIQDIDIERYIANKYGRQYLMRLKEIIDYCCNHRKRIIISSVPVLDEINDYNAGIPFAQNEELKKFCAFNNIEYFNCYEAAYRDLNRKDAAACFYENDLHWNDKGALLFSKKFAEYITKKGNDR